LALARFNGALAGDQYVLAEVMLALGEVVVALDGCNRLKAAAAILEEPNDALYHLLPVEQGKLLGPVQVLRDRFSICCIAESSICSAGSHDGTLGPMLSGFMVATFSRCPCGRIYPV